MKKLKCQKCKYEWLPRTEKPKRCPNQKCQTARWRLVDKLK